MDNAFDVLGSLNLLGGIRGASPVDAWNQGALAAQQIQQNQNTLAAQQAEVRKAALLEQRQAEYQRDLAAVPQSGNVFLGMSRMIAKYPEFKDALKASYDSFDQQTQRAELRQASDIWHLVKNGMVDRAIELLETRAQSERHAGGYSTGATGRDTGDGNDPSFYEGQLKLLKSGNPKAIAAVQDGLAAFMASVVPDKFASVLERAGAAGKDWKVVGPTVGYGDDEGNWHTGYVAPDRFTIGNEGGTRFETPGFDPSKVGTLTVKGIAPAIVAQESSGNYAAVNRETGAMGAYQVMPATAQTLAGRLGLPWKPDLMTSASDAGRSYQDRIGQAAVQEAIDASGGDPVTMASYYHGGSDRSRWGPQTQRYASEVVARLGGGQQGAAPVASVPKAPKEQTRILSPQEVAVIPNLDPSVTYQQSPEGTITPVGGQKQGQLKPLPAPVLQARASNIAALRNIDSALSLLDPKNKTQAAKNARNAIGTGTGMLGDTFSQWHDPDGADFRAQIGQIGGLIIKDTSGAAVSVSEDQRLAKWVPKVTDTPTAVTAKLKNLKREIAQRNQAIADTFSEDQGYRPIGGGSAPIRVRSLQEALKLKPGTIFIDPYNRRKVR